MVCDLLSQNIEQELTPLWGAFGRLGWNDGTNESFAYTEIDRTADVISLPSHLEDAVPFDKFGMRRNAAAYPQNGNR